MERLTELARRPRNKGYDGWLTRHLGDLRYMVRASRSGRLPDGNRAYIEGILLDVSRLPKPREIAEAVHLTNEQRERHKLWTIPPVDMTKEQLTKQRRVKNRRRMQMARRKANMLVREAYLAQFEGSIQQTQPWLAMGISRRTYFRRKQRETGSVHTREIATPDVTLGPCARNYTKSTHTLCHRARPDLTRATRGELGSFSPPHNAMSGMLLMLMRSHLRPETVARTILDGSLDG